ncbi:MAG: hypothetical protein UY96_C0028G0004 [Parcubacteria group bacterium GW2011_GWB1_56_8]|nr:MAG: hypothetical protein UY96_C0028G0004 [Parcubacteria group bacterium GW2011_GWB1_56_8]
MRKSLRAKFVDYIFENSDFTNESRMLIKNFVDYCEMSPKASPPIPKKRKVVPAVKEESLPLPLDT